MLAALAIIFGMKEAISSEAELFIDSTISLCFDTTMNFEFYMKQQKLCSEASKTLTTWT